jgi:hypothetical protein
MPCGAELRSDVTNFGDGVIESVIVWRITGVYGVVKEKGSSQKHCP